MAEVRTLNADERGGAAPNGKDSKTVEEAAVQLTRESKGWSASLGQSTEITYAYRSSAPLTMPEETTGFSRFNAQQIAATELALAAWADVSGVRFVRVQNFDGYSNSATLLFGNYSDGAEDASAFAYLPDGVPSRAAAASDGDVWINVSIASNANPVLGEYGLQVLTHEIGHALGLSHPSPYDAGDEGEETYEEDAIYFEDSKQYSIMSYFPSASTGGKADLFNATPQLDDIAAAQRLYGPNTTTRTGDTVYGFNATADRPWFKLTDPAQNVYFSVWDAGGTDTLDFSGYGTDQVIDLRQGAFSSVGISVGNVSIAMGAVIENAVGGAGADVLRGNPAVNRLVGGAGSDALSGLAGADHLAGESGSDTLHGGDDRDLLVGGEGMDSLWGGAADDALYGGTEADRLLGEDGQDHLAGWLDADTLSGGFGDDVLTGEFGGDELNGDQGADTLYGGDEFDLLVGGEGLDVLWGGAANDALYGGTQPDQLFGEDGDDRLAGWADTDTLAGGLGDDVLAGEPGADVLYGDEGADTLYGGDEADLLAGGQGLDVLWGGLADDALYGGTEVDQLFGEDGNDRLAGWLGADTLAGGAGDDVLAGEPGLDALYGDAGADSLYGGEEADLLVGGEGVDMLWGGLADDALYGGGQSDQLFGEDGNDHLAGWLEADTLTGGAGDDLLAGEPGRDVLSGDAGADTLFGGDDDDTLTGGEGADRLFGGAGADRFVFSSLTHGVGDVVSDFRQTEGDKLDLSRIDARPATQGDDPFIVATRFTGRAGEAVIAFDANRDRSSLRLDTDGNGQADLVIEVGGELTAVGLVL